MHIVAVAWMFVVVLMTLAEATSSQGTVLGAFFTLLLYGVLPLGIVLYVMGTPARGRARRAAAKAAEADGAGRAVGAAPQEGAATPSAPQGNGRSHAAGAGLPTERKEP
jgi:predicted membrane channel-forming protein YqfA (hemolysin III family)